MGVYIERRNLEGLPINMMQRLRHIPFSVPSLPDQHYRVRWHDTVFVWFDAKGSRVFTSGVSKQDADTGRDFRDLETLCPCGLFFFFSHQSMGAKGGVGQATEFGGMETQYICGEVSNSKNMPYILNQCCC